MNTKSLFIVTFVAFVLNLAAYAVDDIDSLVLMEIKKTRGTVKIEYSETKRKLEGLKSQREKVVADAKKRQDGEKAGIDYFKNTITLINARYVDDKGEYRAGMEISVKDQEFINRLFGKYLSSQPLSGRTSAGEAIRMLKWGINRIDELAQNRSAANEATNPELEIIDYQIREAEKHLQRTADIATRLGIKAEGSEDKDEVAAGDDGEEDRAPASNDKGKKEEKKN